MKRTQAIVAAFFLFCVLVQAPAVLSLSPGGKTQSPHPPLPTGPPDPRGYPLRGFVERNAWKRSKRKYLLLKAPWEVFPAAPVL
jgi:hypothetical protein